MTVPDHEVLAEPVLTAQHYVRVGMFRVEMVDGDPVEPCAEIHFHRAHQITDEGFQVFELGGVLRRDDEAKLMAVSFAAVAKGLAVRLIMRRIVKPTRLILLRDVIALYPARWRLDGLP